MDPASLATIAGTLVSAGTSAYQNKKAKDVTDDQEKAAVKERNLAAKNAAKELRDKKFGGRQQLLGAGGPLGVGSSPSSGY